MTIFALCVFVFFPFARKLYLPEKKNKYLLYNLQWFSFFSKRKNMEVYAGATEETSVFDVDTSEPSSTSLSKSFMMQTRN